MNEPSKRKMPDLARGRLANPRARIGLIIPSVNTLSEPQFTHFCPPDVGLHVARLRMSGRWKKPLADLDAETAAAASLLADVNPNLIVFHCTGTSMREGPGSDIVVRDIIRNATGIDAITTGGAIVEALRAFGARKLVLISPSVQSNADCETAYLHKSGFSVLHDVALGLKGGDEYTEVLPERWVQIAVDNARPDADAYFLACTNTTHIEAIEAIEQQLGKPVVSANQAVIWACLSRLRSVLGLGASLPGVGRLMNMVAASPPEEARSGLTATVA